MSDTHDFDFDDAETNPHPLHLPTPQVDVLLHCGDLTQIGGIGSFKKALKMLGSINAELKLVIAGNHDLELDKAYCDESSTPVDPQDYDMAFKTMMGPLAAEAGVTFLTEGTYTFTLKSGATFTIHASPYTPVFGDWAFAYEKNEDRFNGPNRIASADGIKSIAKNPVPNNVDIIMTHGPAYGILDRCSEGHVGCPNLLHALRRVKPLLHCFGHIHDGYGTEIIDWNKRERQKNATERSPPLRKNEAIHRFFEEEEVESPYPEPFLWRQDRGNRTLAVNAAIRPANAPWLISLDLPRSS